MVVGVVRCKQIKASSKMRHESKKIGILHPTQGPKVKLRILEDPQYVTVIQLNLDEEIPLHIAVILYERRFACTTSL
jgi:hypothetical protein